MVSHGLARWVRVLGLAAVVATLAALSSSQGEQPEPQVQTITSSARLSSRAFFSGPGVFVAWPEFSPPAAQFAADLKAARVVWLAVRLHDGLTPVSELLKSGWIEPFRAAGIKVGGWGVLREAPEREANLASALLRKYALTFYLANAEAEYKIDAGGVRRRAYVFVRTFRALRPSLAAGLSTYGAASGDNIFGHTSDPNASVMDFASWYNAGFDLFPQAYENEDETYAPEQVARHSVNAGWPLTRVHPTIGIYEGARGDRSVADYLPALERAGMSGHNVYLGEHLTPEDLGMLQLRGDLDTYFGVIPP